MRPTSIVPASIRPIQLHPDFRRAMRTGLVVVTSILLSAVLAPQASAQFTLLADLDTPVPGGTYFGPGQGGDTFSALSAPEIDGETVVFVANTSDQPGIELSGIFRTRVGGGPIEELVTRRNWLPGYSYPGMPATPPWNAGEGIFPGLFGPIDFQGGRVAFMAAAIPTVGVIEQRRSVYLVNADGTGLQVAYRSTAETIGNVGVASDRVVVFDSTPVAALHQHLIGVPGSQIVVASGDPAPGAPGATFFLSAIASDNTTHAGGLAFYAFSGGNGLWRRNDTDTDFVLLRRAGAGVLPAAPFTIGNMSLLRADHEGAFAFRGGTAGNTQTGVFTQRSLAPDPSPWSRRDFDTIATTSMPAPSGAGNYAEFLGLSVDSRAAVVTNAGVNQTFIETDVAFRARDASGLWALYAYVDDQVRQFGALPQARRVIGVGELIDGKTISHVEMGRRAIAGTGSPDGPVLVFVARFTDGSQGIYSVRIDEVIPRSGVSVVAETFGAPARREEASGVISAAAAVPPEPPSEEEASGEGIANPFSGEVNVGALARGDARVEVRATQQFLVRGPSPGAPVDVSFSFGVEGTLGVSSVDCCHQAAVHAQGIVHQRSEPPLVLFDGQLSLTEDGTLSGTGEYADPGSSADITDHPNPFNDGRPSHGARLQSARFYPDVVQAQVGETLSVEYRLDIDTEGEAIADFSNTLLAEASTDTPGASLAVIQPVPLPEPGREVVPLLLGLLALLGRSERVGHRSPRSGP